MKKVDNSHQLPYIGENADKL